MALRKQHLEQRRLEMVDSVSSADREMAIKQIIKLERIKMKHQAIQNRLRSRNAPLNYVVDTDGNRKTNWEMIDSIVHYNEPHFAQARTNGASAVQRSPFADSLCSYCTEDEVLITHSNTFPLYARVQSPVSPQGDTWACIRPCVPP